MSTILNLKINLFASHPNEIRFFITSDGNAFRVQHLAEGHTSSLKDRFIAVVYNPKMSDTEVREFEKMEKEQFDKNLLETYKRSFPELAKSILFNASLKLKQQ